MASVSPERSLVALSLGSSTHAPVAAKKFTFPTYSSFPPFYTLQPNLTTRARQLDLWSGLITAYCAHYRLFKLCLSSPPADLFSNAAVHRSLKVNDVRTVLDHMSQPANGPLTEWIIPTTRAEQMNTCFVYWRSLSEWADSIYDWVNETGQKGAVLTVYEIREGEVVQNKEWRGIDEVLLRKILNVLVKRGRAQIFGQEEDTGVKFF